jgi:hypothetical protein
VNIKNLYASFAIAVSFLRQTSSLHVMCVVSPPPQDGKYPVRLLDSSGEERHEHVDTPIADWLHWAVLNPTSVGPRGCTRTTWTLEASSGTEDYQAYCWMRPRTPTPIIEDLSCAPDEIKLGDSPQIVVTATVSLDPVSLDPVTWGTSNCYQVIFKLLGSDGLILQESKSYQLQLEISHVFSLGAVDLEKISLDAGGFGQVRVLAQVEAADDAPGGRGVAWQAGDIVSKPVRLKCEMSSLKIQVDQEQYSEEGILIPVTVPIRCAPLIRDFVPVFSLEILPTPQPLKLCPLPRSITRQVLIASTKSTGLVTEYVVNIPYDEKLKDCQHKLYISGGDYTEEIPIPTLAPTLTPTPMPTSTPECAPFHVRTKGSFGCIPIWKGKEALFAVVVIALICFGGILLARKVGFWLPMKSQV